MSSINHKTVEITPNKVKTSKNKVKSKQTKVKQVDKQVDKPVDKQAKQPKAKQTKPKQTKQTKKTKQTKQTKQDNKTDQTNPETSVSTNPLNKKRYYNCYYNGEKFGRLGGKKPKQAANKAFSSLLKRKRKNKENYTGEKITFYIIECTRHGKRRENYYTGERKLLEKPVIVSVKAKDKNGVEYNKNVTYYNKNIVKKIKKADLPGLNL